MRSEIELTSGMSCSISSRPAPVMSRIRSSSGPSASVSRCAMPDDGSSNRITFGSDADLAGEVDDPPAAGGEVGDELVAVVAEADQLDAARRRAFDGVARPAADVRQAEHRLGGVVDAERRDRAPRHTVWWTVSAPNNRASWNDRASPSWRPARRGVE